MAQVNPDLPLRPGRLPATGPFFVRARRQPAANEAVTVALDAPSAALGVDPA